MSIKIDLGSLLLVMVNKRSLSSIIIFPLRLLLRVLSRDEFVGIDEPATTAAAVVREGQPR